MEHVPMEEPFGEAVGQADGEEQCYVLPPLTVNLSLPNIWSEPGTTDPKNATEKADTEGYSYKEQRHGKFLLRLCVELYDICFHRK